MMENGHQVDPYSAKIWKKSYDEDVEEIINIEVITLVELLKRAVNDFPDRPCYDFRGATATYKEFEKDVIRFANFLIQNGVKKGDRVAIHLPNSPQYLVALFGTFYAGCISMGMSFLLKPTEILYQLQDSGAVVLFTMDSFYEQEVRAALSTGKSDIKTVITTNIADTMYLPSMIKWIAKKLNKIPHGRVEPVENLCYFGYKEIMNNLEYSNENAPEIDFDPTNDIAFLQYTGGTTGVPKGAILTHKNLISNIQQINHWISADSERGNEILISGFPLFHLAGMAFNLISISLASLQILIPDPRDVKFITKKIKEHSPTIMCNVPTLYLMLYNYPGFHEIDSTSFKGFVSGAAPFPSESINQFEELVGKHKVVEVYGMTEASPLVTMNPYRGKRKVGSVGIPLPNTEVKLVDTTDRQKTVPLGEPGEVVIKGPQIFKGYWNKPEETKNALKDGWFYSGDVGIMDEDGFITIVDRTKDMIIVSGFKVFSVEIDDKMSKHPAIELCATVGIPDSDKPGSEIVKLYVLLKKDHSNTQQLQADILEFARENLASYKVPKIIEIRENLPLTAIGKLDKKVLRKI
ncbi:MAG: long-chain fatty acid--CoA ligase [Promethearchaeota archaeon]